MPSARQGANRTKFPQGSTDTTSTGTSPVRPAIAALAPSTSASPPPPTATTMRDTCARHAQGGCRTNKRSDRGRHGLDEASEEAVSRRLGRLAEVQPRRGADTRHRLSSARLPWSRVNLSPFVAVPCPCAGRDARLSPKRPPVHLRTLHRPRSRSASSLLSRSGATAEPPIPLLAPPSADIPESAGDHLRSTRP